jgi:hypothetical protein
VKYTRQNKNIGLFNPLKHEAHPSKLFENSVLSSKKANRVSTTKLNLSVLFREIIAQSVSAVQGNKHSLLRESYETHK